jgi:hypothetical protein
MIVKTNRLQEPASFGPSQCQKLFHSDSGEGNSLIYSYWILLAAMPTKLGRRDDRLEGRRSMAKASRRELCETSVKSCPAEATDGRTREKGKSPQPSPSPLYDHLSPLPDKTSPTSRIIPADLPLPGQDSDRTREKGKSPQQL